MISKNWNGKTKTTINNKYFNYHWIEYFRKNCIVFNSQPLKKKMENALNYYQQKKNCTYIVANVNNDSKLKLFKPSKTNIIMTTNIHLLKRICYLNLYITCHLTNDKDIYIDDLI